MFQNNYFTNYADGATLYVIGNNPDEVVSKIKSLTQKSFTSFAENKIKANLSKCHTLLSGTETFNFSISELVIHNSHKLLGVTFDN